MFSVLMSFQNHHSEQMFLYNYSVDVQFCKGDYWKILLTFRMILSYKKSRVSHLRLFSALKALIYFFIGQYKSNCIFSEGAFTGEIVSSRH